jgi:EpsI family protein
MALALALGLAVIFGTGMVDNRAQVSVPHRPFAGFPVVLGVWHGSQRSLDPAVLQGLQLSDYWLADYRTPQDPSPVDFYMAFYATQHVGSATHSPANCIPGGGWQIVGKQVTTLAVDGKTLAVSRLLIRKADTTQLVYYWFDERGRDITETYLSKWYMMIDAVAMHRTDGALIRLVTPIAPGESEQDADRRLQGFLALAYPAIGDFVPGGDTLHTGKPS